MKYVEYGEDSQGNWKVVEFGEDYKRTTLIERFDVVAASDVAAVNKKLYVDKKEGFIGISMKSSDYV